MVRRLRRLAVPLACLALLALTTQAKAAYSVTLTQSGGAFNGMTKTLTDGGVGDLSGAGDGIIIFAGAFGDFVFDLSSVRESGAPQAMLQTSEMAVRNSATGLVTLTVQAASDPFTAPGIAGDVMHIVSNLASDYMTAGGSATYVGMIDSTPLPPLSIGSADTPTGVSSSMLYARGDSFTLSSTLSLTLGAYGSAQVTGTTMTAMPEPGSAMLVLIGFPVIGLGTHWFGRRRRAVTMAV